jgi:hypothetical protein
MKRKLLLVTGAGASVDFGFPLDEKIHEIFMSIAKNDYSLTVDPDKSIYSWVKEVNHNANYESNLYFIECMWGILNNHSTFPIKSIIPNCYLQIPCCFQIPCIKDIYGVTRKIQANDCFNLYCKLVDGFLDDILKISRSLETDKSEELSKFKSFIDILQNEFEISYVTTNYDNVLTTLIPNANTGFDETGNFDRSLLLYNTDWNYGIHLHGSVFFDMQVQTNNGVGNLHKICWNNDLQNTKDKHSYGRNPKDTREGLFSINSTIITGYDKTNQILREPFYSYYTLLDRLVYESDAILFIGCGFQDKHLNSVFSFIGEDTVKTRKVGVIDLKQDIINMEYRREDWVTGLFEAVQCNLCSMSIQDARYLSQNKLLDTSSDKQHPLSICYGGLMSACEKEVSEKIVKHLL